MAKTPRLRLIPLGGLGEIGRNMMAVEYDEQIVVVDAGLMFPEEEMLGVDLVLPDVTYLIERKEKVLAFLLTHGHEDHVGALPYVLPRVNAPLYGSRLTLGFVKNKLKEHKLGSEVVMHEVKAGDVVELPPFKVEFIHVAHSIPDTTALAIETPVGLLVHTADFKMDQTPVDGQPTDMARLSHYGNRGVMLMMSDSTNAERDGFTPSERTIGDAFEDIFGQCPGRIIVSAFASNIYRIQQAISTATHYKRKVAVVGRSMVNNLTIAQELGYLKVPTDTLIKIQDINKEPDEKLVILSSGSQGEPLSALTRIAAQEHPQVKLKSGDTVILSATPIPGNEELVSRTINNCYKHGARVFYSARNRVHTSGHASREELKLMLNLVRPTFFMPVHGEYRHLALHAEIAEDVGISRDHVIVVDDGNSVEVGDGLPRLGNKVPAGYVFVDGLGVGDVGSVVLRDRRVLSQDGLFIVILAVDKDTGTVVGKPDLISRGFVHQQSSDTLLEAARERVTETINKSAAGNPEWQVIKNAVRDSMSKFLYDQTRRRPMIIPIVVEV
ncbi:MAG TPA: ribonuclease J [Candidatus Limnocylindrales bacterium]|nr:ribonuclease J [Candidatus Limnocylindrales bacterium]